MNGKRKEEYRIQNPEAGIVLILHSVFCILYSMPRHMYARSATWWIILRISIEERLVYRGDFALGTLMRFLPIVTQIFLWGAIFSAIEVTTGQKESIAGYTKTSIIAYYLLTM